MAKTYWQDRMQASQARITEKNRRQIDAQLRKYYKSLAKQVIADYEAVLNKVYQAVQDGRQVTPADLYKLDKYWQMQQQLRGQLNKLGEKEISTLTKIFELNFFDSYWAINIDGLEAFNTIDEAGVRQLLERIWVADGKSWSERVWENTNLLADTLNEELIHCVATGKPTSYLRKMLRERFNVSYSRADALVRTELAHVQTEAAKQRYRDYGLEEVEIWADPDERTCPICEKLHKKVYPVGANVPIPAHPRCRCCIVPVIK